MVVVKPSERRSSFDQLSVTSKRAKESLNLLKYFNDRYKVEPVDWQVTAKGPFRNYKLDYSAFGSVLGINQNGVHIATLASTEQVDAFVAQEEEMAEVYKQAEDEIVDHIRSFEPTTFMQRQRKTGTHLTMLGEYVSFYITKTTRHGKQVMVGKWNNQNIICDTLPELVEKLKKVALTHYKKNRLRAITSGSYSMGERYMYEMFGKVYKSHVFEYDHLFFEHFETVLPATHIQDLFKSTLEEDLKIVTRERETWFKNQMKAAGKRNRLKAAYDLRGHLFCVTASKIFVFDIRAKQKQA
jgi:hypothetical protein